MMRTHNQCTLCGGEELVMSSGYPDHNHGRSSTYGLSTCKSCNFSFTNPEPERKELTQLYFPEESLSIRQATKLSLAWRIYYFLARRIGVKPPGKLLDVGCGYGKFMAHVAQSGWEVMGIDEFAKPLPRGSLTEARLPIYFKPITDIGLPDNEFDVITYWWSLEHLPDPLAWLTEAFRLLKPGGRLIATVPNIDSVEARLFGEYWYHLDVPRHLSHFSPDTLSLACRMAGFKVMSVRHDALTLGLIGSVENWLRKKWFPRLLIKSFWWHVLSIPWDLFVALLMRNSGLITVYCTKDTEYTDNRPTYN